jgi:hypothetical protein
MAQRADEQLRHGHHRDDALVAAVAHELVDDAGGSRAVAVDEAGLTVLAAHRLAHQWIGTRYRAEAEQALAAAAGRPVDLRVVVEEADPPITTARRVRGRALPVRGASADALVVGE